jgi:hypothetical protein
MQTLYEQSRDKAFDARRIWRQAEREQRELTDAEREQMESLIDKADELREQAKALEPLRGLARAGVVTMDPNVVHGGERPGDAFVKSKGYQAIRDSAARPSNWSSGPVEVKATLLEATWTRPKRAPRSRSSTSGRASRRSCFSRRRSRASRRTATGFG